MNEEQRGGRRYESAMTDAAFGRLSRYLWPKGERREIWMVLDGARDMRVFETLLTSSFVHSCLYSGFIPPAVEASAPYLVQLEYEDHQTRRLLDSAWHNNWGILLRCDARLEVLRKHLRSFLTVRDPNGQRLLFRFYDPRILRLYLPSCTGEELRAFFGPIEQFWTENDKIDELVEFNLSGSKLITSSLPLNPDHPISATPKPVPADARPAFRRSPGLTAVRGEQMNVFSAAAEKQFEDWMVEHLNRFFANRCQTMGEERLRDMIRHGIRRAASHELTIRREVCKYIDVMMVLGRDFDRDAHYPWAGEILARRGQAGKGQALIDDARFELRRKRSLGNA